MRQVEHEDIDFSRFKPLKPRLDAMRERNRQNRLRRERMSID